MWHETKISASEHAHPSRDWQLVCYFFIRKVENSIQYLLEKITEHLLLRET